MLKKLTSPPMGWNSWDCFGAAVNEAQLLKNAEFIRDNLKEYGWEYVVCDIQWYEPKAKNHTYNNFAPLCMDEYSRLIPAPERFPSAKNGAGFKPIADKIHGMGLKFGIHIMRGIPRQAVHYNTPIKKEGVTARDIAKQYSVCPWNTDMYGVDPSKEGAREYYYSLFDLYASWGVDFIKCDDIANTEFRPDRPYSAADEIELIHEAVEHCGREMVLSLSPGPAPVDFHDHLASNANMWRMSGDFWDEREKLNAMFDLCRLWSPYVKEGAYPDCDMLPLGRLCVCDGGRDTRFTDADIKTMMTLWCIFSSPLMIGADLRSCDEKTLSYLTKKELIGMNKNSRSPREIFRSENKIIWEAEKEGGGTYIAVFNITEKDDLTTLTLTGDSVKAENLWTGETFDLKDGKLQARVEAYGAEAFLITKG